MPKFKLPDGFKPSALAPTITELEFIHDWILNNSIFSVNTLEFGCGVTTVALHDTLKSERYVTIEHWRPCIDQIKALYKDIEVFDTIWTHLPKIKYDFVFIDSSAGYPPGGDGIYREEAAKFVVENDLLTDHAIIAMHDWHRPQRGHQKLRKYLDKNFKLTASFNNKSGVGIYFKG